MSSTARRYDAYERVLTATLAMTVTVSYGVLLYAFPVMLTPMQAESGWSRTLLTGGFSAAALMAGVAAIPVGRWIDRHGPRVVMTAGSVLACVLLLAWSRVQHPVAYLLVWVGLGACMAAVFYEPAFAAVAQWADAHRARAFAVITLAGGLASTLFVPLASALTDTYGWRKAVVCLAFALGTTTILPHALVLRSRTRAPGAPATGMCAPGAGTSGAAAMLHAVDAGVMLARRACDTATRPAWRTVTFRWIGAASFLATMVNLAVAVHLVPMLLERGFTAAVAAGALGLLGLAKLPGRMLIAPLAARTSTRTAIVIVLALQVVALLVFSALDGGIGLWLFIVLFGAGDGAATPARAELIAELFGAHDYGRTCGVLAFVLALGRAAGPIGAALAWTALGGYDGLILLLAGIAGVAAVAMTFAPCGARRAVCCG